MLKKIRKILILSLLGTILLYAKEDNSSNINTEINEIIKKAEVERKKEEKEEKRREKEAEKIRKAEEKEAKRQSSENNTDKYRETTIDNQFIEKGNSNINNEYNVDTENYLDRSRENTNSKEKDINTNNNINENTNPILNIKNKEKPKSKIDKSKPVVMAEDREKEVGNQYKDSLMRYIATKDGKILKKEYENKIHPISSLTKVMNIIVALDQIDKGNANLEDRVCFTSENANIGGSWLNVKSGDCFMLRDLIRAEIIYSANNAAYLVANHIGKGNIDNFIKLMNEKAKELGMNNTTFYTPAGLPTSMTGKGMDVSTAYDLYLLGKKAIEDERIREWGSEPELVLLNDKGEQIVYPSRNHLLGYHGIYGLKTGFHNLAGFNIIVSSKIGNIEIISVVLGHVSNNARTLDQKKEFVSIEKDLKLVYSIGEEIGYFKIKNAKKKKVLGVLSDNIYQFKDTNYEFKTKQLKPEAGKEGIKKGDLIGKLEIIYNDKIISEVDILSTEDVEQISLFRRIIRFITFGLI